MRQADWTSLKQIVAPEHTALLVIDIQNDFCSVDGVFGRAGQPVSRVQEMIPRIASLVSAAREVRAKIAMARVTFRPQDFTLPILERYHRLGMPKSCVDGSWGAEFYSELFPQDGDAVFVKHRFSAFYSEGFRDFLSDNGIRTLLLAGCLTNVCVESTARQAYQEDYFVVVPSDCVASYSEEMHQASLTNINRFFGRVSTLEELREAWVK